MTTSSDSSANDVDYHTFIREHFLDPNGSNAEYFFDKVSSMTIRLLEMYTNSSFDLSRIVLAFNDRSSSRPDKEIYTDRGKIVKDILEKNLIDVPQRTSSLEQNLGGLIDMMTHETRFNERFMGQMHPHDNIDSYVASMVATFVNGNTIAEEVSRVTTNIERHTINWLLQVVGFKPDRTFYYSSFGASADDLKEIFQDHGSGIITSGGTSANLSAMTIARNLAFKDIAEKGVLALGGAQGVIIGSEYAHYSWEKIAGLIGLGSENFIKARTDDMRLTKESVEKELHSALLGGQRVVAVVANAGSTETGMIDDLQGIADVVDSFENVAGYRPFFHIDAAHGGGLVFHPAYDPLTGGKLRGLELADSITLDPHKMLYTHYPAGSLLLRDHRNFDFLKQSADYLFKDDGMFNLGGHRLEGSMGLQGALMTYLSIRSFGRGGYTMLIDNAIANAHHLERLVADDPRLELLHERDMNLLVFRYSNEALSSEKEDEVNRLAQKMMVDRNKYYFSNDKLLVRDPFGKLEKREVFRAVMMHPYTTKKDISDAFEELNYCIDEAERVVL